MILPFRKKKAPEPIVAPPDPDAEAIAYYQSRGVPLTDRCVTRALIREDAPGTFRVMCFACVTGEGKPSQFDLFGTLHDARQHGGEEGSIVQQIIEHQERCSGLSGVMETTVLQNKNTPHLYQLTVRWPDVELKAQEATIES